ncbi:hypothetical protein ACET3Z_013687 [Daucus carota]
MSPSSDPPKYNPEDVRQPIELPMTLQMTQLRLALFPLPIITLERGSNSVYQVVKCLCAAIHMSSRESVTCLLAAVMLWRDLVLRLAGQDLLLFHWLESG